MVTKTNDSLNLITSRFEFFHIMEMPAKNKNKIQRRSVHTKLNTKQYLFNNENL